MQLKIVNKYTVTAIY